MHATFLYVESILKLAQADAILHGEGWIRVDAPGTVQHVPYEQTQRQADIQTLYSMMLGWSNTGPEEAVVALGNAIAALRDKEKACFAKTLVEDQSQRAESPEPRNKQE